MRSALRIAYLAVLLTCSLSVSTAFAQRGGRGGGLGGTSLASIASNEAVQKELGLSGDVTGKLTTLRDDYRAAVQKEYQNAGIELQNFQSLSNDERQKMSAKILEVTRKLNDEFNPKIKALVSSGQYARLAQINLQYNLRFRGPGALTYASVASELKLTDDQKKKLDDLQTELDRKQRELFTGGGGGNREEFTKLNEERITKTMDLLTAEQKETLNKLKGEEFDVSQLGGGRGRRGNN